MNSVAPAECMEAGMVIGKGTINSLENDFYEEQPAETKRIIPAECC